MAPPNIHHALQFVAGVATVQSVHIAPEEPLAIDVRFGPLALKRAITWAERHELDFVTALPQVDPAGFLADTVFAASGVAFGVQFKPWRVRDRSKPDIFGIGAFMLVRRAAYDRSPGMAWLKLEGRR